jgi:xanthine dehydrogenase accessory factor
MTATDLLDYAQTLNRRGDRYAMVTVVRVTPPTSAYVGAQAIVLADGSLHGSVGGGCSKQVVADAAREAIQSGIAKLVRISNAAPGSLEHGVELRAMQCASDGEVEVFIQPHTPAPLLLVLGATPAATHARSFAEQSGFRVTDCAEGAESTPIDIALVATQGEGDADALHSALASSARHVLLIASHKKGEWLREAMRQRGVSEQRLALMQSPAGPDIGAHSPAHIALAAVAGAVACWQKTPATAPDPRPVGAKVSAAPAVPPGAAVGYINPVCGIGVDPAGARHTIVFQGEPFYFCCDGCKLEFERDPAKYAAIQAGRPAGKAVASPASVEAL